MKANTRILNDPARSLIRASKAIKVRNGEVMQNAALNSFIDDFTALQNVLDEARKNIRATMEQYGVKRIDIDNRGYIGFIPYTELVDDGATSYWKKTVIDTKKVNGYKDRHGFYPEGIDPKVTERFRVAVK